MASWRSVRADHLRAPSSVVLVPPDLARFQAWLHGTLQSLDDLGIQVTSPVLDETAVATPRQCSLLDQVEVAPGAKSKGKDSNSLIVSASFRNDIFRVSNLAVCENEDTLSFGSLIPSLHRLQWLEDIGTAKISFHPLDVPYRRINDIFPIRDYVFHQIFLIAESKRGVLRAKADDREGAACG